MLDTVLLTGTIKVMGQEDHQQRNTTERTNQYITNIIKYIVDSPFNNIIFCENSNYKIEREIGIVKEVSGLYGKRVEFLQFQGDAIKTQRQGRGYGESEIMEHAINHSTLLHDNTLFVKITGRYLLANAWDFAKKNQNNRNMFVRMAPFQTQCSTACYIIDSNFYRTYLQGIGGEVDDGKGKQYQLEGVFYKRLKKLCSQQILCMNTLPIMKAVTGSGYILEPNCIRDSIKQFLNILGLYKL